MGDFSEMVKQYPIKYDAKLKKICAPLKEYLGISVFCYFSIDQDGRFANLANCAEALDFCYTENFHLVDSFFLHPHLLRSGCVMIPLSYDAAYLKIIRKAGRLKNMLLIILRDGDGVEECYFDTALSDTITVEGLYSNIELLYKFIRYFKREAAPIIERMKSDNFNIKQARGKAFLECDPSVPLSNKDPNIQRFLKLMLPLSSREQQCLALFKEGKSAQMTGAILGLSQRTIESYFDNIKNKLNCHSKADLLKW